MALSNNLKLKMRF